MWWNGHGEDSWAGFGEVATSRGLEEHVGHALGCAGRDLVGEPLFVIDDDSLDVEDTNA